MRESSLSDLAVGSEVFLGLDVSSVSWQVTPASPRTRSTSSSRS
jgi:hypothetical protein